MTQNLVTELAKERQSEQPPDTFVVEGVIVRLVPVPSSIIQDAVTRLKPPPVPTWHNPDKGRDEPNPNDPGYLAALEQFQQEKGKVANDAMVMFGAEIVEGFPPENDRWLRKLQKADRLGILDLSWADPEDDIDQEFLFLKYVAITTDRLVQIGTMAGLSREAVAQAAASFRRNQGRGTDTAGVDQE